MFNTKIKCKLNMKQRKIKARKQNKARSRPGIKNVSHAFPYTARYNRWN